MHHTLAHETVEDDNNPKQLLAEARTDLAEKVSIAGLKEAFQEHITWIRRVYQISIVVFACCILYKTYRLITIFLHSGYKNEITGILANLESLPVSNVTVCAQVYFNETFIKTNLSISDNVLQQYTSKTGQSVAEFYAQLTLFLSFTLRPRKFSPIMLKYFKRIVYENRQIHDSSAFAAAALPSCESMLKKCWFGGKQFDCCRKAVQSIDDDGICYLMSLNFDSDNAFPTSATVKQTKPGPKGGLTVEASLNVKDFPWLDDDADNGFKIYVDAVPYGLMQSPVPSPSGAETYITVKAKKQLLLKNCASHGHLSKNGPMFYYDPQGTSCFYQSFIDLMYKYMFCHGAILTHRPNNSIACTPAVFYSVSLVFTSDKTNEEWSKQMIGKSKLVDDSQMAKFLKMSEHDAKAAFSGTARCPRHCQYWDYSSSSSFIYLEKTSNEKADQIMFSKIHVFYGDLEYKQYAEIKPKTGYLVFCDFSNVVMLYLGMSVISFFDISFYFTKYLGAWWRLRKGDKKPKHVKRIRIRNIKVHPNVNEVTL